VWQEAGAADAKLKRNGSSTRETAVVGELERAGRQPDGANCSGQPQRCSWLFDLAVDADERTNLFEARPEVVSRMVAMLDSWAAREVTCVEARTCGPADPAGFEAFEREGYFVPWLGEPPPKQQRKTPAV
jgi:hypothetical protein